MLAGKNGMYGSTAAYNFYFSNREQNLAFLLEIASLYLANDISNGQARQHGLINILCDIIEQEPDIHREFSF